MFRHALTWSRACRLLLRDVAMFCFSVEFLSSAVFYPVWMVSRQTSDFAFAPLISSVKLSPGMKLRKGCSESYTCAFPATSWAHFQNDVS